MNKKIGYTRETNKTIDELKSAIQQEFKKHGFYSLFDMDMRALANEKLNQNFSSYYLMGFYSIPYTYSVKEEDPNINMIMPTNIVLYEIDGKRFISSTEPKNMDEFKDRVKDLVNIVNNIQKNVIDTAA